MATNIEIKARLRERHRIERIVSARATAPPTDLRQEDTFFNIDRGRLKLRITNGSHAELIQYDRADQQGPTSSRYTVVPVAKPSELRQVLGRAYGERATLRKRRRVYLVGNTRVHLDIVENLGEFIELEVVLSGRQQETEGVNTAHALMKDLNIREEDLIEGAYVDLLEARAGKTRKTHV